MSSVRGRQRWRVLLALLLLLGTGTAAEGEPPGPAPVAPRLAADLARTQGPVSFLVILAEQPDPVGYLAQKGLSRGHPRVRAQALYAYLTAFAARRQASLRAWLDAQGVPYRAFYLVNALEVTGDAALVAALRRRPEVGRLAANPRIRAQTPTPEASRTAVLPDIPYGIRYTRAPQVWLQGYRGQGIVVASQDTGVDWEHPALKPHYRGWDPETQTVDHRYNWYDAWGSVGRPARCDPDPQVPCDDNGHGTHTVGTMVGYDPTSPTGNQVGMAPEARWIGCRNMDRGVGTPASYMACFQFFLAPHPQDGDPFTDGDPSRAPHVINNSWYCPPDEGCDYETLRQAVQTVDAAGILVVGSGGNNGPECASIRYPIGAYPEVFSVAAHNATGQVAYFSSRGPVTVNGSHRRKPDLSAPGVDVVSTLPGGRFGSASGTSMAAPHVAGAVALLWSAAPHLVGRLDETRRLLEGNATPVLDDQCEPDGEARSPNNVYGYGRLDVAAAVAVALAPARLTVQVTMPDGRPAAHVPVQVVDTRTGTPERALTGPDGRAVFAQVYAGTYRVRVDRFGVAAQETVSLALGEQAEITLVQPYTLLLFPVYGSGEAR